MVPPTLFLAILIAFTLLLLIAQLVLDRTRHRKLISLAREWRMHFAPDDRFNLAARVAEKLSLPGAADVRIADLIYGSEEGTRRYVFSAHYTRGVVRWKHREKCVASLSENKDQWSPLNVAPGELSVVEQYRAAAAK
jgi:hypothetical protein